MGGGGGVRRGREVAVGATVLGALIAVVASALWLSQTRLGRDQTLRSARFREVGGLKPGAPVALRGVKVGRVTAIRLAANGGFAHGNDRFKAEIAEMPGRRVERGAPGRPTKDKSELSETKTHAD